MRRLSNWLAAAVLLLGPGLLVSCAEQDVNKLRSNYTAELSGFIIKERPAAVVDEVQTVTEVDGEEAAAGEEVAPAGDGETAEEEGEVTMAQFPASHDVLLDIVLSHQGAGSLPGLTLDVYQIEEAPEEGEQIDPTENPKDHWQIYVDTSDLSLEKRVTHTLEDIDVEDDDGFAVLIRSHVPPEERDAYQEFSRAEGS